MIASLKEILADISRGKEEIARALSGVSAGALWGKAVSEREAKETEPITLKNGVFYVLASNSAWAQELSLKKSAIIKKMNSSGAGNVRDIRFKIGRIEEAKNG